MKQKVFRKPDDVYIQYDLNKLQEAAEKVCNEAPKDSMHEAVNWGDLSCISAEFYVNSSKQCGYRVVIEEASPDATEFHKYVVDALARQGFWNVEVITEW